MKRLRNVPALLLTVLVLGSAAGYYLTRDADPVHVAPKAPASATQPSLMDQRLLQTARQMSSLAETPEERGLAAEALRLSDHELDQAFATALREATTSASSLTPPLQKLATRVAQLKTRVARLQERIAQLQKSDPEGAALDLAKAQLALQQDELDDAREDLARQGGDPHASIERALQEHEAAQRIAAEPAKPPDLGSLDTLASQLRLWIALGNRVRDAVAAGQQASAKATALARQHDGLENQVGQAARPADDADVDPEDTASVVTRLRRLSDQTKTMRQLDARIQDAQQLAAIYQRWTTELETRRRGAAHLLLRSFGLVFAVLLGAVLLSRAIRRGLQKHSERRRLHQLRFMATLALQLVAAMAILLLIFGPPTQISTIIGLATAGLTVVLKDFILAFFGWFVLMGRNGIRLGDWVEIRGVSGEVIEIGLLRTVLLEMGNWTRTGHPTGRRAAFVNSFAIEGHYFNFSTAGQWLWDELQLSLPVGLDPYAVAEEIRAAVEHVTEPDANEAAADWERVTTQYGTRPFSARPAVDLRPSKDGYDLVVRYITRAPQRYDRKSQLFQEIVGLLQKRAAPSPVQPQSTA